jgi:hypothetical protein
VKIAATMLYADLADSTALAMWDRRVAARVCKAFLAFASRLIRASDGEVRSFDGDRVMGVFIGKTKNTSAVKCALKINHVFENLLKPRFAAKYEKLRDGTYKLGQCTGIDTSEVLVVRAGSETITTLSGSDGHQTLRQSLAASEIAHSIPLSAARFSTLRMMRPKHTTGRPCGRRGCGKAVLCSACSVHPGLGSLKSAVAVRDGGGRVRGCSDLRRPASVNKRPRVALTQLR